MFIASHKDAKTMKRAVQCCMFCLFAFASCWTQVPKDGSCVTVYNSHFVTLFLRPHLLDASGQGEQKKNDSGGKGIDVLG